MTRAAEETDLLVVGAGPAGMSAAAAAAGLGLRVLLIDDNARPGGQYWRTAEPPLRTVRGDLFGEHRAGAGPLGTARAPGVAWRPSSVFLGRYGDGTLAYADEASGIRKVHVPKVVIAAGATERPVPFPGWTLPGVMGAGAAQNLMKSQRVLPGRRILVAGNGPLALLAAANLLRAGGTVVEVLEASHGRVPPGLAWRLALEPTILARGIGYRAALLQRRVPYRPRHVVVEARGGERVQEAVVAPLDSTGRPDRGRARVVEADAIVLGMGLVPATEATRSMGAAHCFVPRLGGWVPMRNANLETTVPGVFAVGECAGVAGMEKAALEGRLVGLITAAQLRGTDSMRRSEIALMRRRLRRLLAFRVAIDAAYAPTPFEPLSLLDDGTVVCRCEEVEAGVLRAHLAAGATSADGLKTITRAGMGRCQGRNCLVTVAALFAAARGTSVAEVPLPRPRPPLRPVPMRWLLDGDE